MSASVRHECTCIHTQEVDTVGNPVPTKKILKGSYTTILTLLIGVRCCTLISELISDSAPTRFLLFVIFFIWKFRFKIARFLTRIRFTPKQIQINSGSHFTFHARFSTQHTQFMHIHFQYVLNKIQNIYNWYFIIFSLESWTIFSWPFTSDFPVCIRLLVMWVNVSSSRIDNLGEALVYTESVLSMKFISTWHGLFQFSDRHLKHLFLINILC